MKTFCMILVSIVVLGCSTSRLYGDVIQTWIGHDVNELIQSWGPPASEYKMPNGSMMYTWWRDGGAVAMPIANMAYAVQRYCKTTFTVNELSVIESGQWEGNACNAK